MLRNREWRRFVLFYALLAAGMVLLAYILAPLAALLVLVFAAFGGAGFYVFTRARYQRIAALSEQIDQVLHNEERYVIAELSEGELSILQSEITKMTLRIREQNASLRQEKAHLAEALGDIAHQLRTPLTSANLLLAFLAEETDVSMRRQYVRETEELLLKMDWLITALLKLSRLDAGVIVFKNEPVDVGALVRAALKPLAIPLELHQVNVQLEAAVDMTIVGDALWLGEALQNVLKNALESASGGKIAIICTDNPLYGQIVIHDSGPGFAPEDLPRLFERFYQGQSAKQAGYGIGLALSQRIITSLGGTITAHNAPEGGAVFTIRLPK